MTDLAGPIATVVVLNWNGGERLLPDCLDTLAKQDLEPTLWRTWVVDNASTDGSLDLLDRRYPDVHVVRNATNLGFAGGNNVALRTARTPFVVLLNNDARPQPDWLRHLLGAARAPGAERVAATTSKVLFEPKFVRLDLETPAHRTAADPRELGAMITRVERDGVDVTEEVLWDNGAHGPEGRGATRFRWTVDVEILPGAEVVDVVNNVGSILVPPGAGADRGYQEIDRGQYDEPEDVFLFCGAAVCFRRDALDQVGVFDDDFFMYYEDTDLSLRFQAAGWSIRYAPDAVVRHLHSASSVEWSPFFTFHVERNRLLTLAKNAPAGLAVRQAARFAVTTASMARWALLQAVRDRRRPDLAPLAIRLRVSASYLRLLPRALRNRRRIARPSAHSAGAASQRSPVVTCSTTSPRSPRSGSARSTFGGSSFT